ncbi:gamma-glutamyltranspeptidase 3 [Amborella trichopoda]|uniref:gamma-glutamyltranspeptidase 3 n=1 Tax=Amborella trichopoda TaxID=13333 RepID=UPI0005D3C68F|nr:gamma-glutamyltranspeptidase 3 [Amborella trichopoda]|eukprot:XP_011621064.1 gamma-glutamyltranspeptidase 3 [Amborella trichopoda]
MAEPSLSSPLLIHGASPSKSWACRVAFALIVLAAVWVVGGRQQNALIQQQREGISLEFNLEEKPTPVKNEEGKKKEVEAEQGVVAADHGRCAAVGVDVLREGGHAMDAAVATALCLGVLNPIASGIGGGAFLLHRSSETGLSQAFDMRETAPAAASQDMYNNNEQAKKYGALAVGVPGELAGLHTAWLQHGRLPWKRLVEPAIRLARDGFPIARYLGSKLLVFQSKIMGNPGLRSIFAPNGELLKTGEICYNKKLAAALQAISDHGPLAFYNGSVGEMLVEDVKKAGGIITMDDLRNYRVEVSEPVKFEAFGHEILGMPPPSSGAVGLSLVLNIFASYGNSNAAKGDLGLHRLIEAMKHMFAIRMNLGDPNFVNVTSCMLDMLSSEFASKIRERILDNTTFPPDYYMNQWSQLRDHGTSHFCIVDANRNAVSMTSTVNSPFGGGMVSQSTGILLNNEMDDFSTPTEMTPDHLPPAPANFIAPNKRPLSSMSPFIVLKDGQLAGVIGGSNGIFTIPAVVQVFIKHFIFGMDPLSAVQHPRVYHQLIPNEVSYENWTVLDGEHYELSGEAKLFLEKRGHELQAMENGGICQMVVHNLRRPTTAMLKRRSVGRNRVFHGMLTAVSDARKDGFPSGF